VAEGRPVGVFRLAFDPVDGCADLGQAGLDLSPTASQTLGVVEVTRVIRVGELEPHHQHVGGLAVQRVPGRVRATVLHRLKHAGHLAADGRAGAAGAALVNDPRDTAHVGVLLSARSGYGRTSKYSSRSHSVTVAQNRSHSSRL